MSLLDEFVSDYQEGLAADSDPGPSNHSAPGLSDRADEPRQRSGLLAVPAEILVAWAAIASTMDVTYPPPRLQGGAGGPIYLTKKYPNAPAGPLQVGTSMTERYGGRPSSGGLDRGGCAGRRHSVVGRSGILAGCQSGFR